ncbi:hypothetical protein ACFCX4_25690 [Kitasatospora sp. NPDC056327]|uniref:YncE family protein n=1 Tax=Kitasatospora sp. NPDC056327 TaxID=3345785 RepID=UPI0035E05C3A
MSVERGPAGDGAVLLVDLATYEAVGRVGAGAPGPHWSVFTPDGRKGYTANKEAGFLSVLGPVPRRVGPGLAGTVPVPGSEGLAVTPDGRHLVVAAPKFGLGGSPAAPPAPAVVDVRTGRVVHTTALGAPAVPVHVTAGGPVLAAEVRLGEPAADGSPRPVDGLLRIFSLDGARGGPAGAEGSDDSDGSDGRGGSDGHDAVVLRELGEVPVGRVPLTLLSSPDGTVGYVANTASDTVTVVDLVERRVLREIHLGPGAGPHGMAYVPALG